jgi:hypothetical protein
MTTTTITTTTTNPTEEVTMSQPTTTLTDACENAVANWKATDGGVVGGFYRIDFGGDLGLRIAEVRVHAIGGGDGIGRLVATHDLDFVPEGGN